MRQATTKASEIFTGSPALVAPESWRRSVEMTWPYDKFEWAMPQVNLLLEAVAVARVKLRRGSATTATVVSPASHA